MKVLVVVDMQNDFIDGALGTPEAIEITPKVVSKVIGFEGKVYATRDIHGADYLQTQEGMNLPVAHCIDGTNGCELCRDVFEAIKNQDSFDNATTWFEKSTFGSTKLIKWLLHVNEQHDIEEVELVGICTDICVISNAMLIKAFLPEIPVTVDASCCAGVTPESHKNALSAMKMCQINVINE